MSFKLQSCSSTYCGPEGLKFPDDGLKSVLCKGLHGKAEMALLDLKIYKKSISTHINLHSTDSALRVPCGCIANGIVSR